MKKLSIEQIELLSPELKESEEDEKIRKEIIEVFKRLGEGTIPANLNYADIFTWLEKQGKKPAGMRETKPKDISEFLDRLTTVEQEFLWEHIAKIRELDKQEQKSDGWHREDEQNLNACLGYIRDEFLRRWLIDVIHSKYDKPSWSEEDEDMRYKAKAVINRLCAEGKEYVWSVKTLKKLFYWLNSLKDRVQPQPKQE